MRDFGKALTLGSRVLTYEHKFHNIVWTNPVPDAPAPAEHPGDGRKAKLPKTTMKHYQRKTAPDRKRRGRPKTAAGLPEQELNPGEAAQPDRPARERATRPARVLGPAIPVGTGEKPLSQRQTKMLAFIQEFTAQHFRPPSIREITMACRISSTSVTDYNLRLLEHWKYLTRKPGTARSIVLTGRGRLPLPDPSDTPAREAA